MSLHPAILMMVGMRLVAVRRERNPQQTSPIGKAEAPVIPEIAVVEKSNCNHLKINNSLGLTR